MRTKSVSDSRLTRKHMKSKYKVIRECFPKLPYILFVFTLQRLLRDCDTVLDIGCGGLSPVRYIDADTCGVDADKSLIAYAKAIGTHKKLIVLDVRKIDQYFKAKTFDAVVALDLIEHLTKKDGYRLLKSMEKIAQKKVIIFTPNGFMPQNGTGNKLEDHLSGWDEVEMKEQGYAVHGMFGPKVLRGALHKLRFRPEIFWGIISEVIQWIYIWNYPRLAAAILCIKNIKKTYVL